MDPKPTIGVSPYAAFRNNPIWFNDPLGDTLSNPQLVDALKIANTEVRNRLIHDDGKGFYNEGATKSLGKAIASYAEKNKLSNADLMDFYTAAHQYYNGLGTMAENSVLDYLQFNESVLNSKTLDSKNTIVASNYYLKKSSNEFGLKWTAAYKAALETAFGAAIPMSIGKAPRAPISNYEKLEQLFKAGYQQSFVGDYWLLSKSNISNGVFRKEIWGLAWSGNGKAGNSILRVLKSVEAEAQGAGARSLIISGKQVVETKFFEIPPEVLQKLGYQLNKTSEDTFTLTKSF